MRLKKSVMKTFVKFLHHVKQFFLAFEVVVKGTGTHVGFTAEIAHTHGMKPLLVAEFQRCVEDTLEIFGDGFFFLDLKGSAVLREKRQAAGLFDGRNPFGEFYQIGIHDTFIARPGCCSL